MPALISKILLNGVLLLLPMMALAQNACLEELKTRLGQKENEVLSVKAAYVCGAEDAQICLVRYQSTKLGLDVFTFLDKAHHLQVDGAPIRNEVGSGSAVSGHHLCVDVKTYLETQALNAGQIQIEVSRMTAWEQLICPFHKTYLSYTKVCRQTTL